MYIYIYIHTYISGSRATSHEAQSAYTDFVIIPPIIVSEENYLNA